MYKIIVRNRAEYKSPLIILEADDLDEANDTKEEVEQIFGQALILTDQEFKELKEILQR